MFHEIYPHKFDITYAPREAKDDDFVVIYKAGGVFLKDDGDVISLPCVSELGAEFDRTQLRFLFTLDENIAVYMADIEGLDGYAPITPRDLRNRKPMWISYASSVAARLIIWYRSNKYCSRCGKPLIHSKTERAMVCSDTDCKNVVYPSICPSVIVLIRDGNRALLTRYAVNHSAYRRYALVAGYVETGESPEETVQREVFEEVGLKVKNIKYYKSQPWPLSGALLLGYVCDLDGSDRIRLDENELEIAEWLEREELPDRSNDVSLTSELIEMFRTGKL